MSMDSSRRPLICLGLTRITGRKAEGRADVDPGPGAEPAPKSAKIRGLLNQSYQPGLTFARTVTRCSIRTGGFLRVGR